MKVHFIAIGGSAMHNLALALHKKGYLVTGSDDEIFEPARTALDRQGLLPDNIGWDINKITSDIDAVILGMHAKEDNPELVKAKQLNLKIYSYPEYLYEQSKNKVRIVIGGSHGKTTITAMILHVLAQNSFDCDYMVGAKLDGFDIMVKLTDTNNYIILEGDEYLSSPIDRRPKFHLYKPDIAVISGIAWDHINVFPTFENYVQQFKSFIDTITPDGVLIYNSEDDIVAEISQNASAQIQKIPYSVKPFKTIDGKTNIIYKKETYPLKIFGKHNLSNIEAAHAVCNQLNISSEAFYSSMRSFNGASKRLEVVAKNINTTIFKDFAHSPSKLKATVNAVKDQYPNRNLVSCLELHTYSSLNPEFLPLYKNTLDNADIAIVYFNPHALKIKKLPELNIEQIKNHFAKNDLIVFNDSSELKNYLLSLSWKDKNLLMMSSGDFDNLNFNEISSEILNHN